MIDTGYLVVASLVCFILGVLFIDAFGYKENRYDAIDSVRVVCEASGLETELTYSKENWFTAKCKGDK
jgi:hypothetical protein